MKIEKVFWIILTWLPSILMSVLLVLNATDKILYDQLDKIITNRVFMGLVGLVLLISTALFMYNKTIIYGASILVLYLTSITFIHLLKGKPFEVVLLLVIGLIFATFLRKSSMFSYLHKGFVNFTQP